MITWEFNKEKDILEVIYSGKITVEEFIKYGNSLKESNSLPKVLKILTYARKANYDTQLIARINQSFIKENLKQQLKAFTFVKNALLHDNHLETAISFAFKEIFSFENYIQKAFFTLEAAIEWLNYPLENYTKKT